MMRCGGCGLRWTDIEAWIRDYDNIQCLAVKLIYAQIGCALIGSIGALYNGVLLVDLGISLFALVAIESSSQSLARTYAVLLFASILLEISWFFLFSHHIWHIPSEIYGTFGSLSVKLTLTMQIIGFSVRLSSSLLWIQMYRLGASYMDTSIPRDADADLRNSFLSPTTPTIGRQPSSSDDVVGGSIYDPAYYSSLFEDGREDAFLYGGGENNGISVANSVSTAEASNLNQSNGRHFHAKDAFNQNTVSEFPGCRFNKICSTPPTTTYTTPREREGRREGDLVLDMVICFSLRYLIAGLRFYLSDRIMKILFQDENSGVRKLQMV